MTRMRSATSKASSSSVRKRMVERPTAEARSCFVQGRAPDGSIASVRISPEGSPAANPAFDVTPARLITGLITERGVADASPEGLKALFPERS
nr:hypothetical protein [Sinorhizobium medicae]